MSTAASEAIRIKNVQYQRARAEFARRLRTGEVHADEGIFIASAGVRWGSMNNAFLSTPVADETDLRRRIEAAERFFRQRRLRWRLTVCDQWVLPPVRARLALILAEHGFSTSSRELTGMTAAVTNVTNVAPMRTLPSLEYEDQRSLT